jgi:hypothetical protein
MKVYVITPLDNVQLLGMSLEDQVRIFRGLVGAGQAVTTAWDAPKCDRFKKPRKRKPEPLCDFTAILGKGDAPVLSRKAKNVLEPIFGSSVQWLPLEFEECEYWLLNVLRLVEIDETKSEVHRDYNGSFPRVLRHWFHEKDVANEWVFKTRINTYNVLCIDRLRDLVAQEQLTGFWFGPMWDSVTGNLSKPGMYD